MTINRCQICKVAWEDGQREKHLMTCSCKNPLETMKNLLDQVYGRYSNLIDELEAVAIILLSIAICTFIGVLAAWVGDYWWGTLGRLGINSPVSWICGMALGFAQVVACGYFCVRRLLLGRWL